ncbi:probable RNA polymerase II nuclear localization protein SLC7A6OS [Stomoxys calcitrans]|uniref:probable RNA polymerase II nuclear localization protein SLC7A6OS n=1 Tax=Stomoxys calcitrans TaxID=35570 RepID=UPI0027E3B1D5|nr:probable RNA polymerase II nuclear localization protein SLC7A6OS [Stomoxys calcitrans]
MPAVVRVKRRVDEEPLSAFVLNSKRRRLDENDGAAANKEELSTLLKFAGTINEQDDSATTQYARLTKEEAKELVLRKTRKPINATEKARQEMRKNLQEQRFRVVNCLRTTLESNENNANETSKEITIVDIEKHNTNEKTNEANDKPTSMMPLGVTSTSLPQNASGLEQASTSAAAAAAALTLTTGTTMSMPSDSDTGYVYDLYIPDNEQHADYVDLLDENYLSVRPFDDLIYEDRYNNDDQDDEYDSDDSNQENYFGNEYPDEDEDKAMNSDRDDDDEEENDDAVHLARGLDKFVFGEDDEEDELGSSSSDDDGNYYNAYRDPYVHSIDPEEDNFCEDVDSCDVDRYGMAYARYKARVLKKLKPKLEDEEEEDDDGNSESERSNYGDTSSEASYIDEYYDSLPGDYY